MKETVLKEGILPNIQDAPAFTAKYLDEEKEDSENEILTLRFNAKYREMLDIIKYYFHEPKDATAIKYALEWAKNDIQAKLSLESWRKLTSDSRRKPAISVPRALEK